MGKGRDSSRRRAVFMDTKVSEHQNQVHKQPHRAGGTATQDQALPRSISAELDVGCMQLRLPIGAGALGAAAQCPLERHGDGWLRAR